MIRMKKNLRDLVMLCGLLVAMLYIGVHDTSAQTKAHKGEKSHSRHIHSAKISTGYFYLGGEFFSPFFFGDLYSITPEKTHIGIGGQLKVGYRFSPVFGLELNAGYGQNSASALGYQQNYMLGIRDAYTYYPYTMIDGVVYTPVKDIFGEQGKHNQAVALEGIGFDKIRSDIRVFQTSLNAVLNLNRLFTASATYREYPLELLLKPGVYMSRFSSEIVNKETGEKVAPNVNRSLTFGAGGDLTLRYNASRKWAFELTNRFVWERDRAIDGVLSARRAYDDYTWQPAVAVIYKFTKAPKTCGSAKKAPRVTPTPAPVTKEVALPNFTYVHPEAVTKVVPKQRAHSATISLTYELNKTAVVPTLANNRSELNRIDKELREYVGNPDVTIRKIVIDGFASPEGALAHNLKLSEGRAASLIDYVQRQSGLDRTLFTRGEMGENWEGLRAAIEASTLPTKGQILEILSNPDSEARKQAMKSVDGYATLLRDVYPALRLSRYTVDYEVRGFEPQEARTRIKSNPKSLSPEEIYSVALLSPAGSTEYREALGVIYTYYPDSDMALYLKGCDALSAGNPNEAVRSLTRIGKKSAGAYNTLGVAYAKSGDLKRAAESFQSAIEGGDMHASSNLAALNEYTDLKQN